MTDEKQDREASEQAARLSRLLRDQNRSIALAESLTSGMIATRIGEAPAASEWFRGAVVAYAADVKFDVLGVTPGPVVTSECASEMARGVARLMRSDYGLGITGVGGPGPDEGKPAGTVFIAVCGSDRVLVEERTLDGDPSEIVLSATLQALRMAVGFVHRA